MTATTRVHWIFVFLVVACALRAQSFSVFDIDTSNFPIMKAKFYAFDAATVQQQPQPSEILLTEDGIPRTVQSVSCPPAVPLKRLSSVLVMDVSSSMDGTNLDIARTAATTWVAMLPLGQSECALSSFDDHSYLVQDFTTNKSKLLDAISNLRTGGGTDYDYGLLLPPGGGLQITKSGKYQKILVFLTDGLCTPNFTPAIIAEANAQQCQIHVITVGLPCPQVLKDIAAGTSGTWHENVTTEDEAKLIYEQILGNALATDPQVCTLTWESQRSCNPGVCSVAVTWSGKVSRAVYYRPTDAIQKLAAAPGRIIIPPKQVGQSFDTTIVVTAVNMSMTVTDITSINPQYDIAPKSFTLANGESKSLVIRYTPTDSTYSWTRFDFQNNVCSTAYYVSGMYFPRGREKQQLKVIAPNGGEVYVVGSDTLITWEGIALTDPVALDYSTDNGAVWMAVTDEVSGGEYLWHVPNTPSPNCLVRVSQLQHNRQRGWAIRSGGPDWDEATSIAVDTGSVTYITGWFEDDMVYETTRLGNKFLRNAGSKGTRDAFVIKYEDDSVLWARRFGGGGDDFGLDITVDGSHNVYALGRFEKQAGFGADTSYAVGKSDIMIIKYRPDGSIDWRTQAGGTDFDSPSSVTVDRSGNVYVTGGFYGTADFGGINLTSSGKDDIFIAKYLPNGTISWARSAGGSLGDVGFGTAVDTMGNVYVAGSFASSTATFGSLVIQGDPNATMYLAKYHPDGSIDWVKTAKGGVGASARSVAIGPAGEVYVTGVCGTTADFGDTTVVANSIYNFYIAKFTGGGSLDWIRFDGNSIGVFGRDIATGRDGSIYVTGEYEGTLSFGVDTLTISSDPDRSIFVNKYFLDGTLEWVKHPIVSPNGREEVEGIAVDDKDNVFVTGYFADTARFETSTLAAGGNKIDLYIWKLSDYVLQSDTSDARFSIILPSPLSHDIDMGDVLVGRQKDSVIIVFIENTGTHPFQVTSIDISGAHPDDFALVSGVPPFTVPAAGGKSVEFRFSPTAVGPRTGQLQIETQANTIFQTIIGNGVEQSIMAYGKTIDFGAVQTMTSKDTTITIAIVNSGTVAIDFTNDLQLGPDTSQFTLISGTSPFTLAAGASHTVQIRFSPTEAGRTSGRIAFVYSGPGSPAIINVFGEGIDQGKRIATIGEVIDFGKVLLSSSKDTTVTFAIQNVGSIPVDFTGIVQLGPDLTQFSLISGGGNFQLLPQETHSVTLRFSPTTIGKTSTEIGFVYDDSASPAKLLLKGEGVEQKKTIAVLDAVIDFGAVDISSVKDTTITLAIQNVGDSTIEFTSDVQLGPDLTQFKLLAGGGAFTLAPLQSREVMIRFAPIAAGMTHGSIGFEYNGVGSPAVLELSGVGLGGLVKIADDSAYPGEKRNIAVELLGVPSSSLQSLATGFRARIAYNATVLAPFGGNVARGSGVDTVTVEGNLGTDNSLTSVPFLAALGNAEVSSMDLVESVWLDAQGQPANYDVETESGTFKVLGVCEEGGKRLFNPEGQVTITRISPNPASESVQVEIETIEAGRTQVVVMDVLGRTVATLYDGEIASGSHKLNLNTSQIAAGSYYVSLVTPTVKKFARVDIAR